jgi:DNA-binding beta-propeller fold protein YncE
MGRQAGRIDFFAFLRICRLSPLLLLTVPLFTKAQSVPMELAAHKQLLPESAHGTLTLKEGPAGTLYALNQSVVPASSVWVTDYSGTSARRIVGAAEPAELRAPRDLAVDRDGNAIVVNGDGLVKIFSGGGKQLSSFQAERPHAVAVLSDGRILVSGFPREHLMSVYSREGKLLGEIGELAKVDTSNPFGVRMMNMGYIVVDDDDNIYYIFRYLFTATVRKYTPDGSLVAEWHPEGARLDWAVAEAKESFQKKRENGEHGSRYILSAGAFDKDTGTLWLASGQAVFQLDGSGHTIRNFLLTAPDGLPVQVSGLVVNQDFLCASGPLHGTFEFPKPH